MRHRKQGRKLSRTSGQRKALYRNLITDLFQHERLQTTEVKARAIRRQAEKLITLSRRGQADRILELIEANDETTLARMIQAWVPSRRRRGLRNTSSARTGRPAPDAWNRVLSWKWRCR